MKTRFVTIVLTAISLSLATLTAIAEPVDFNFLGSTPVGSWQLREETTTDHKGRQQVAVVRSSLVGEEIRDGEKHYWLEMQMDSFKIKKDKRKPNGDTTIFKSLVAESAFNDDPANAMNNMRAFGKEIIMQVGDDDPIRISGAGKMAESMLKSMGTEINYAFETIGEEDVSLPSGSFQTRKIYGSGSTEMKVVFKKITVESTNTVWISDDVPFGMVKSEGQTLTNGKQSSHSSQLLEYGKSGAVSVITKTPEDLPAMPSMKDLLKP